MGAFPLIVVVVEDELVRVLHGRSELRGKRLDGGNRLGLLGGALRLGSRQGLLGVVSVGGTGTALKVLETTLELLACMEVMSVYKSQESNCSQIGPIS